MIVPCLLLEWARGGYGAQACVVRLYFLTQLLDEAAAYLHRMLTASALGRRVFHLPFSRDVVLTAERTQALHSSLACCRRVGGALVVAPEHRLSMLLKRQELSSALEHKAVFDGLCKLEAMRFIDIFGSKTARARRSARRLVCFTPPALTSFPTRPSSPHLALPS